MKSKMKIAIAMIIWGSLGIFVKNIDMPSMEIAFFRAIIASVVLIGVGLFNKELDIKKYSKKNLILLILSGFAMGINWVLLFQAYKFTTIANATLSYYFAPVFVVLAAPIILKEKLSARKVLAVLGALIGLFLILKAQTATNEVSLNKSLGIIYGLSAALLYTTVIFLNKSVKGLSGYDRTIVQLISSGMVLIPFVIVRQNIHFSSTNSLVFVLILGIIHTALAYLLYFGGIKDTPVHSAAVLSYIDPISALVLGALFLGETMSLIQGLGGALILISTFFAQES